MVLFLTCWLPFHVIFLLLKVHWLSFTELPEWSLCLIQVLVVVYPSLSPCIFAFRCKKLQRELKRMLRKNAAAAKINADLPTNTRKRSSFRPPEFTRMTLKKPNITRHSSLAVSSIPRDVLKLRSSSITPANQLFIPSIAVRRDTLASLNINREPESKQMLDT